MNFETIARPYAQAIYDHSEGWEVDLEQLELALKTPEVQMLIDSPKLAYKEKTEVSNIEDRSVNNVVETSRGETNVNLEERIPMSRLRQADRWARCATRQLNLLS